MKRRLLVGAVPAVLALIVAGCGSSGSSNSGGGSGSAGSTSGSTTAASTTQVTYAGHPLYTFAGDRAVGQTRGQGVNAAGAEWYVVGASTGDKIDNDDDKDSDSGY